jgi:hypothetical protein
MGDLEKAASLRVMAKEMIERSMRAKTALDRKQLELWAQELIEDAEQIERQASPPPSARQ